MLYVMRHGKTDWNEKKKLQGRTDIPLNEEGRTMAMGARKAYEQVKFDICYCSPLSRARETAEIFLQGREIPILYDDRLQEMSFGDFEGTERASETPDCPVYLFFREPERYKAVAGAESFEELFARTGAFLREEVEPRLQAGENVLIVGHGAMNSSIVCQKRGLSLEHFWEAGIENCKLMEV